VHMTQLSQSATQAMPGAGPSRLAPQDLLAVRRLIFRDDTLCLLRFDAVSKTSICLDGHTLNDGVNLWLLDLHSSLRPLTATNDGVV
jgi:hypothetical protein